MDDVGLGLKMLLKGKISLLPERGDRLAMERMVKTAERITRPGEARQRRAPAGPGGEA